MIAPGGAPSLAQPVLATPVRAIVPETFPGLANPGMSRPSAPDCIDFGIDPLFVFVGLRCSPLHSNRRRRLRAEQSSVAVGGAVIASMQMQARPSCRAR